MCPVSLVDAAYGVIGIIAGLLVLTFVQLGAVRPYVLWKRRCRHVASPVRYDDAIGWVVGTGLGTLCGS